MKPGGGSKGYTNLTPWGDQYLASQQFRGSIEGGRISVMMLGEFLIYSFAFTRMHSCSEVNMRCTRTF